MTDKGIIRAVDPAKNNSPWRWARRRRPARHLAAGRRLRDNAQRPSFSRKPVAQARPISSRGTKRPWCLDTAVLRVDAFRRFRPIGRSCWRCARPTACSRCGPAKAAKPPVGPWRPNAGDAQRQPAELADLHRDDKISVTHDSPDSQGAEVSSIEATRSVDMRKWALVVGIGGYEDAAVTRPKFAAPTRSCIAQTLTHPVSGTRADHMLVLADISRIRLEQSVPAFLEKCRRTPNCWCFSTPRPMPTRRAKSTSRRPILPWPGSTRRGVPLAWLVARWRSARPRTSCCCWTLLMPATGPTSKSQPSAAEMLFVAQNTRCAVAAGTGPYFRPSRDSGGKGRRGTGPDGGKGGPATAGSAGSWPKGSRARRTRTATIGSSRPSFRVSGRQAADQSGQPPETVPARRHAAAADPEAKVALRKLAADWEGRS